MDDRTPGETQWQFVVAWLRTGYFRRWPSPIFFANSERAAA
jgi:hypothetical protein